MIVHKVHIIACSVTLITQSSVLFNAGRQVSFSLSTKHQQHKMETESRSSNPARGVCYAFLSLTRYKIRRTEAYQNSESALASHPLEQML